MAEQINTTYNDDSIQTLEWNEHIRRRAGMYIGRLGNGDRQGDGIYVLLRKSWTTPSTSSPWDTASASTSPSRTRR